MFDALLDALLQSLSSLVCPPSVLWCTYLLRVSDLLFLARVCVVGQFIHSKNEQRTVQILNFAELILGKRNLDARQKVEGIGGGIQF